MKESRSKPDADEDRDEGADEGGGDAEGPRKRRTKAWRRSGDERKIAFQQEIMSRDEEFPRRSREDMRMAAVKTVPRTVVPKGPSTKGSHVFFYLPVPKV